MWCNSSSMKGVYLQAPLLHRFSIGWPQYGHQSAMRETSMAECVKAVSETELIFTDRYAQNNVVGSLVC